MKTAIIKSPHMQNAPIVPGEPVKAPIVPGEPVKPIYTQCKPPSKIGCLQNPKSSYDDEAYQAQHDGGFGFEILFAALIAWALK